MKAHALSELGRRTEEPPISWLMASALARAQLISLAAGFTDNESLPLKEVRQLLKEMLSTPQTGQAALQYGTTAGDDVLRKLTSHRLQLLDGTPAAWRAYSSDRMIISNGSQQMLYMVTEALCDPGDLVLVEDPSYFVYLGILQSHGVRARGIRMEQDGLNLARLEAVLAALKRSGELRRVKMLYLVSYYQNPTGRTTNYAKKAGALKLLRQYEPAAGHPIYLLEDAAYRELRFEGDDVKSALAIKGSSERVIYSGTYSKPFATGTRVGFGLMPEPVFTAVLRIKGNHDFGSSNLLQQLLARALMSGLYQKHLVVLRRRYAHKARLMREAIRQHFPAAVESWEPAGGLYFWARLPRRLKSGVGSKVFRRALANDVLYVPGELCYADDPTRRKPNHEMRLSFGSASEAKVRKGIARLGAVFRDCLGK
ncbi:MAG TPA: PLP-dependent aminotransferase family protein [Candidatus Paceibacterota bacterium]|nr:PLP-dependent aminotransferase family protein [Verrucomicrobiota bacterium]HSA09678.1 PLP-dependent aminotransferase family protein [Candidatus Paceibacterota bacterium]